MSTKALEKQHILVTGAGSGIGRAIALRLGEEQASVALCGRRSAPLEKVAGEVTERGGRSLVLPVDIRDKQAVQAAFEQAKKVHGPLHGLVANSGIGGPNGPGDAGQDRFDELIDTNLRGTYHCLRAAHSVLAPDPDRRRMVVVSSILGRIGVGGYSGYCASKAGLLGLVRALAAEWAPEGVLVNAVCPGWVETDMASEGLEGMAAAMGVSVQQAREIAMQSVPLGRMSQPEEIAGMVRWLLSDDSKGVTGQGIDMNGGAWM